MIHCPTVRKEVIRSHYQLSTLFYRLLLGRHIHHGLWEADAPDERVGLSPGEAQQQLTATLANAARVTQGERVLDVGWVGRRSI